MSIREANKCQAKCQYSDGWCLGCGRTMEEIRAAYKSVLDRRAKNGYNGFNKETL